MSTFKALTVAKLGGISEDTFVLQERQIPTPKPTEVLVKIHAVSLNFRDLAILSGQYPAPVKQGVVPGSDGAGTIVQVGEDVKGWKEGQRVCLSFCLDHLDGDGNQEIASSALGAPIDGVLSEYRVVPAHSLIEIPEYLSFEEASTLPCAAVTAYNALTGPRPIKAGDHILVLGTGGVSIFALQFAVASGAVVIVTSSSDVKLETAKKLGAKHLINYTQTPDWEKEVLKITGGRGVDHVIEVGGAGTLAKSAVASRFSGYLHLIGFLAQPEEGNNNLSMQLMINNLNLRSIAVGSVAKFRDMNRLLSAHQIRPQVDKVFSFEETRQAYEHLAAQKHVGKVVIKVSKD